MSRTDLVRLIVFLILGSVVLLIPVTIQDPYYLHIIITIGIAIILATSLRLSSIAGIFNLGQIAFYAIGAYSLIFMRVNLGLSFWFCLPLTGIITGLLAWVLGYPFLRVKGVYFVMLSLALVEVVRLTIQSLPFLGGFRIISVPPINPIIIPHVLEVEFISKTPYYYLLIALVAITLIVLYRIEISRIGVTLKCIADNERLALSIGINTVRYRVLAFTISSFFCRYCGCFLCSICWRSWAAGFQYLGFDNGFHVGGCWRGRLFLGAVDWGCVSHNFTTGFSRYARISAYTFCCYLDFGYLLSAKWHHKFASSYSQQEG